jgi:hypothetical protein
LVTYPLTKRGGLYVVPHEEWNEYVIDALTSEATGHEHDGLAQDSGGTGKKIKVQNLDVATGQVPLAGIPNLPASRITSGDFAAARMQANILAALIAVGGITDSHVAAAAGISKSKISSAGTWTAAEIPDLGASKITSEILAAARGGLGKALDLTGLANDDLIIYSIAQDKFIRIPKTSVGVTDHGLLTGLLDDDHTQYAKKAGDTFTSGDFIELLTKVDSTLNLEQAAGATKRSFSIHHRSAAKILDIYYYSAGWQERMSLDTAGNLTLAGKVNDSDKLDGHHYEAHSVRTMNYPDGGDSGAIIKTAANFYMVNSIGAGGSTITDWSFQSMPTTWTTRAFLYGSASAGFWTN